MQKASQKTIMFYRCRSHNISGKHNESVNRCNHGIFYDNYQNNTNDHHCNCCLTKRPTPNREWIPKRWKKLWFSYIFSKYNDIHEILKIHIIIILTIGLSECEFGGSYLNGYAGGQKIGVLSFSKAKENCLQGTLIFINWSTNDKRTENNHIILKSVSDCKGITFEAASNEWTLRESDVPITSVNATDLSILKSCFDRGT